MREAPTRVRDLLLPAAVALVLVLLVATGVPMAQAGPSGSARTLGSTGQPAVRLSNAPLTAGGPAEAGAAAPNCSLQGLHFNELYPGLSVPPGVPGASFGGCPIGADDASVSALQWERLRLERHVLSSFRPPGARRVRRTECSAPDRRLGGPMLAGCSLRARGRTGPSGEPLFPLSRGQLVDPHPCVRSCTGGLLRPVLLERHRARQPRRSVLLRGRGAARCLRASPGAGTRAREPGQSGVPGGSGWCRGPYPMDQRFLRLLGKRTAELRDRIDLTGASARAAGRGRWLLAGALGRGRDGFGRLDELPSPHWARGGVQLLRPFVQCRRRHRRPCQRHVLGWERVRGGALLRGRDGFIHRWVLLQLPCLSWGRHRRRGCLPGVGDHVLHGRPGARARERSWRSPRLPRDRFGPVREWGLGAVRAAPRHRDADPRVASDVPHLGVVPRPLRSVERHLRSLLLLVLHHARGAIAPRHAGRRGLDLRHLECDPADRLVRRHVPRRLLAGRRQRLLRVRRGAHLVRGPRRTGHACSPGRLRRLSPA